jgi:hypothetical protein
MKYLIILNRDSTVCYITEDPTLTPPPDFVVEVPDDTIVEVGWTYVPGDTPESFSFVPPVEPEEV